MCIPAMAQGRIPQINIYTGDPTGTSCSVTNGIVQSMTTGGFYSCIGGHYTGTAGLSGVTSDGANGIVVAGSVAGQTLKAGTTVIASGQGVWTRRGVVVYPFFQNGSGAVGAPAGITQEPSVIVEGSPVVLTNYASANSAVWKMWFTNSTSISYAESLDGLNNWTISSTNPIIPSGHAEPNVIKNGSTYYLWAHNLANNNIDIYTATDGVTFTSLTSGVLSNVSNTAGVFINGTLYLFAEGPNGGGLALYTSTAPYTTYTFNSNIATIWKGPSNPVQINGTWYMWVHSDQPASGGFCGAVYTSRTTCSQIFRLSAPAITGPWSNSEGSNPDFWPQTIDEEGGQNQAGQTADPFIVQYNNKTYMYYSGTTADATTTYTVIKLATADMPLSSLVQTNGGATTTTIDNRGPFGSQYNPAATSLGWNGLSFSGMGNITSLPGVGNLTMGGNTHTFGTFSSNAAALTAEGGSGLPQFVACEVTSSDCARFFLDYFGIGTTGGNGTVGHGWHVRGGRNLAGNDSGWFDTLAGVTYAGFVNTGYSGSNIDITHFDNSHVLMLGGFIAARSQSQVTAASTIAPTQAYFHMTGATPVATITAPASCTYANTMCTIHVIPDSAYTTNATGNIAIASTAVVSREMTFTYDPTTSKWYPSY